MTYKAECFWFAAWLRNRAVAIVSLLLTLNCGALTAQFAPEIDDLGPVAGATFADQVNNVGQVLYHTEPADTSQTFLQAPKGPKLFVNFVAGGGFYLNDGGQALFPGLLTNFLTSPGGGIKDFDAIVQRHLGTGDIVVVPSSLSKSGDVVGWYCVFVSNTCSPQIPFLYSTANDSFTDFGLSQSGSDGELTGVNNRGQAVGVINQSSGSHDPTQVITPLGTPIILAAGGQTIIPNTIGAGNLVPMAINDLGHVAGYWESGTYQTRTCGVFFYDGMKLVDWGGSPVRCSSLWPGQGPRWQLNNLDQLLYNWDSLYTPGQGWTASLLALVGGATAGSRDDVAGPSALGDDGAVTLAVRFVQGIHVFRIKTSPLQITNPYARFINARESVSTVTEDTAARAPAANQLAVDGQSAVVAVFKTISNTSVTFNIKPDSSQLSSGFAGLSAYQPDFLTNPTPLYNSQVTVTPTCNASGACTALALVWSPLSLPSSSINVSGGSVPAVKSVITATQNGSAAQTYLELVPPPVVAIHGVWSSAQQSWGRGFQEWLQSRYPHGVLSTLNYGSPGPGLQASAFSDPGTQSLFGQELVDSLARAADRGLAARSVDVVAHSMGGLVARWFVDKALHNNSGFADLVNPVHQLITAGTPHQGSQFANLLRQYADSPVIRPTAQRAAAVALFGADPSPWGPDTLGGLMRLAGKDITSGAISSIATDSGPLNQLNNSTNIFPYKSIVGLAPPSTSPEAFGAESQLNLLMFVAGVPSTVSQALGPGSFDTVVSAASQAYPLVASSPGLATISGIVHTNVLGDQEMTETASLCVWQQVLFWLTGGTGQLNASCNSSLQSGNSVASSQTRALARVQTTSLSQAASVAAPAPVLDLTGWTQTDANSVLITPPSQSDLALGSQVTIAAASTAKSISQLLLFQKVVNATDEALLAATQAPFSVSFTARGIGDVTLGAVILFTDHTFAAVPLHYQVPPPGVAVSVTVPNAPTGTLNPGTVFSLNPQVTFADSTADVTARATYSTQSGTSNVINVAANGVVIANAPGVDVVNVDYGGVTGSALFRVGNCSYQLSPAASSVPASGGIVQILVTTGSGCQWNATSTASTVSPASGNGSGIVAVQVAPNISSQAQQISVNIADQSSIIIQPGVPCSWSLQAYTDQFGASGGTGISKVYTLPSLGSCPIAVSSNADWLNATVSSDSVTYTAAPNPGPARTAALTISGQTLMISEAGVGTVYSISGNVLFGSGALAGVHMVLSGTQSAYTSIDSNGHYAFSGLSSQGSYTVMPSGGGYTFSPTRLSFDTLVSNQSGDFSALTMPAGPTVVSATSASATGINQVYTFQFSDAQGWQDLGIINVLINNALDGRHSCFIAYVQSTRTLLLVDDAGNTGGPFAGNLTLGSSGTINNSQCTIRGATSSASGSGNTLTLTVDLTFSRSFSGNKVLYLAARDSAENNSGWQTAGAYQVPGAAISYPAARSVSPNTGSAGAQTFTFTFQDQSSAMNLQTAWTLINTAIDGRGSCYIAFYRPGNLIYLIPDNGDGSQSASMQLTGTNTLSNSQCTVSAQGSSVTANGNTLVLTIPIAFTPAFTGNKGIWLATQTLNGARTSLWEALGAWMVP